MTRDPLIECELPLGRPGLVAHDELVLVGWAASPKGISGVAVQIGERQWNAAYGLDTPEIARRLAWIDGADRAGYSLAIDTSGWQPGPRVVTVAAFDREGGRAAVEGGIEIRPLTAPAEGDAGAPAAPGRGEVTLVLDSPTVESGTAQVEGALEIRGWAFADEGIEAVLVTLDRSIQYEALRPLARPELLREAGPDVAADAGFALRLDEADCPPGRHRLTVVALGRDGGTAGVDCELISNPAPEFPERLSPPDAPARRRDGEPTPDDDRPWRELALLAESDAALSRAEARLARAGEERARRDLRDAERRALDE